MSKSRGILKIERTTGAVAMSDQALRIELAKPVATILISTEALRLPGARLSFGSHAGPNDKAEVNEAMNGKSIEQEIIAKGLTAPRITPADIEASIRAEVYFTGTDAAGSQNAHIKSEYVEGERILSPLDLLTFCALVLRNGFTVTGESACASPENFDAEIGRKIARQNAVQKIWMLEGYLLKDSLHKEAMIDRATIGECAKRGAD